MYFSESEILKISVSIPQKVTFPFLAPVPRLILPASCILLVGSCSFGLTHIGVVLLGVRNRSGSIPGHPVQSGNNLHGSALFTPSYFPFATVAIEWTVELWANVWKKKKKNGKIEFSTNRKWNTNWHEMAQHFGRGQVAGLFIRHAGDEDSFPTGKSIYRGIFSCSRGIELQLRQN